MAGISEAIMCLQDNLPKTVRLYINRNGHHLLIRDNDGGHDLHVCYFPITKTLKCIKPRGVVKHERRVEAIEVVIIVIELLESLDL